MLTNKCQDCNNKGWIYTYGYDSIHDYNNGWHIEKCDSCGMLANDNEAKNKFGKWIQKQS